MHVANVQSSYTLTCIIITSGIIQLLLLLLFLKRKNTSHDCGDKVVKTNLTPASVLKMDRFVSFVAILPEVYLHTAAWVLFYFRATRPVFKTNKQTNKQTVTPAPEQTSHVL
jgi:hypothetical protein